MPLVPWAKMTMLAQSLISLVILSLVIARAVNLLSYRVLWRRTTSEEGERQPWREATQALPHLRR